jgi:hypothetical protein
MGNPAHRAIGGYFELDLGPGGHELYPQALALQSGRAALLALLQAGRPTRLWMPWYICDTVADAARMADVPVIRYGLDENFAVGDGVEPAAGDWLLYVNYFGLCDSHVEALSRRFDPRTVIIDNSHALFSKPTGCLATLYSPRKFVGVPDGGYLVTDLAVPVPAEEDHGSASRCAPLLERAASGPEAAYAQFLETQEGLARQMPLRMSALTRTLLGTIDYEDAARRRQENFALLDSRLSRYNRCALRGSSSGPFAYPFIGGSASLRSELIAQRIYVSRLWPELLAGAGVPPFERFLANECIPLPCDQRYGPADMDRLARLVEDDLARRA